ncbi:sigma factor-like helix-turn-helix DNA-binding protein [Streptomyces sp. NPDC014802]|uniref:sigma factor-like helix-turn-helix DNA-binding protein n=1 Tax=Streptomyces sp. NPDC014802 TaxID=3364917 RepID=UPI000EB6DFBF|nr:DNA binding protein [Streptomyces phage TrvxScott]QAY15703.1 DNA binding protein [Streptomyces phage Bowden]QAY15868.1 DNA binding protein [Streptomyces phage TinaBelcher]
MAGYNRAIVEKMLPAVWDQDAAYGMKNETKPDPDMPKGHVDKKKGSDFLVHIADVRQAWKRAELTLDERRSVLLRYGFDLTFEEIAEEFGVNKSTTQRRSERGVGKLAAHLNGEQYIDGYDQLEEAA